MALEQYRSCIEACNACADACDHCAVACLAEHDVASMARCVALDFDCAAICRVAVGYMARGSELVKDICGLCARICDSCGEECARFQMEHCKQCATACRRAADECRRMAGDAARAPAARSSRVPTMS